MARINVTRHVAADPASVALLLSEPATERSDETEVVTPPRRSGIGFSAGVRIPTQGSVTVAGDVTVQPADGSGCDLRLVLRVPSKDARNAERAGAQFLQVLAERARSRSFAA